MKKPAQQILKHSTVIGLAVLANMVTVQAIEYLNRRAEDQSEAVAASHRFIRLAAPEDPMEEPPPEEEVIEEEIIELELDLPEFTPSSSFEMSVLDLEIPNIPPVMSSVPIQNSLTVMPSNPVESTQRPATMRSERVDDPPRELSSNPKPQFPRTALRKNLEGKVVVELLIDEEGRVREAKMISGDALFVAAVQDVIQQWRFTPPRHEGRAVVVRGRKTFTFDNPNRRTP